MALDSIHCWLSFPTVSVLPSVLDYSHWNINRLNIPPPIRPSLTRHRSFSSQSSAVLCNLIANTSKDFSRCIAPSFSLLPTPFSMEAFHSHVPFISASPVPSICQIQRPFSLFISLDLAVHLTQVITSSFLKEFLHLPSRASHTSISSHFTGYFSVSCWTLLFLPSLCGCLWAQSLDLFLSLCHSGLGLYITSF